MIQNVKLKGLLILKKLKGPIWYLKNLKDPYDTNIKLKGPMMYFAYF
jgi:hypothetical protein